MSVSACRWLALSAAMLVSSGAELTSMGNRSFFVHLNERNYDKSSSFKADCMFSSRSYMRPYPYDCYSHTFVDAWDEFKTFFAEIGSDLRFTFDFVLYDKHFPFAKENQLWYLMAFLKELRTLVHDPNNILSKGQSNKQLDSFRATLEARVAPVRQQYGEMMKRIDDAKKMAEAYIQRKQVSRRHAASQKPGRARLLPRSAPGFNIVD